MTFTLSSGADPGIVQGGGGQGPRKGRSVGIVKLPSKIKTPLGVGEFGSRYLSKVCVCVLGGGAGSSKRHAGP